MVQSPDPSANRGDVRLRDLILSVSARLARTLEERIDESIEDALADVGASTDVDRAYVMTFDVLAETYSNTHEWVAPGVSAVKGDVQGMALAHKAPWLSALERGEAVQIERVAALDPALPLVALFTSQAIRSMLWVPMPGPSGLLGFVGFDSVRAERSWSAEEVALLTAAANVIAAALERRSAARERDEVARRLTALAALVPGVVYQFESDAAGQLGFPYVSAGARTIFGVEADVIRRDAAAAFSRVLQDDLAGLADSIEVSRQTLEPWTHDFRVVDEERGMRWVRGHAVPERTAGGGTLWHGIVTDVTEATELEAALRRDVTERRLALARLEREVAFRKALVSVTNDMLTAALDDGFYQQVLTRTIELVPDAQGGSMLLRVDGEVFRFVAAVGFDLEALGSVHLTEYEMARGTPPAVERVFVRENVDRVGRERRDAISRAGRLGDITVTLSVPIMVGAEAGGYMNLDNFDRADAFDDDAQAIAAALASQVAVALQRLRLERDLGEERARYERLASHDALTGLPNRRLFLDRLEQAITQAHRRRERVALLYLDLDGFKDVNDALGHDVGDALLEAVARRLEQAVRAADTVARLGGDEFAVVLQEVSSDDDARQVAEKLIESLDAPFVLRGRSLAITASIGVALYPRDARLTDGLMKAADVAMYRVKDAGRGAVGFYSRET